MIKESAQIEIDFSGLLVSVHLRRTDKAKEAKPIDVQVYMQEIQDYFDILTAEGREIRPNVFIATDEPKIIDEIQTKVISYRGVPGIWKCFNKSYLAGRGVG